MIRFDWDPDKARSNERKHGVSFDDAMYVFADQHARFEQDRVDEITGELRWRAIGSVGGVAVIVVAHTVRENRDDEIIRIISARPATRKERSNYEKAHKQDFAH